MASPVSNIIPIPTALKRRDQRVEALCAAVARDDGPRPLIDAREYEGQVLVRVGELELHLSAEEVLDVARRLTMAAGEALAWPGKPV